MTEVKLINIQRLLEAAEYLERRERGEYKFVSLAIAENECKTFACDLMVTFLDGNGIFFLYFVNNKVFEEYLC